MNLRFSVFLVAGALVGTALLSHLAHAETVPGSGINYDASSVKIRYTKTTGSADPFVCFDNGSSGNCPHSGTIGTDTCGGEWYSDYSEYWTTSSPADRLDEVLDRPLSFIGVNSSTAVSDIIYGGTPNNDCFQQAGIYEIKFVLYDLAENYAEYPSDDVDDWYVYTVEPANPHGGPNNTRVEYNDPTEDPSDPSYIPVEADGTSSYTAIIRYYDEFGNLITALDTAAEVGVKVTTILGDIDVDGIFDEFSGPAVMDASNSYDNTASASTWADNTYIGPGATETLGSLLGGNNINVSNLTPVSPGVFSFDVTSYVPTMQLINADPTQGAGVIAQTLTFQPTSYPIDENGVPTPGPKQDATGGTVSSAFAFYPVVEANPQSFGNDPDAPGDSTNWGEVETIVTHLTDNGGGVTSSEEYFLLTPFDQYILKAEEESPPVGEDPEFDPIQQPLSPQDLMPATTNSEDLAFFPASGGLESAPPTSVGVMSHVQYTANSEVIRHISGRSNGPNTPCGGFLLCYPFLPNSAARIIGAQILGSVAGEWGDFLLYQLTASEAGNNSGIGQQTSYAGDTSNPDVGRSLATSISAATNEPDSDRVFTSDTTLTSVLAKFSAGHDVVIIDTADLTIDTNLPQDLGKKTVIVKEGNIFVEADTNYHTNSSNDDSLGIIVYTTANTAHGGGPLGTGASPATTNGHIVVREDVQEMVGSYYASGSLVSLATADYDDLKDGTFPSINSVSYTTADREKQLVLTGILWSNNTLGGSLISNQQQNGFISPWLVDPTDDINEARMYDLHYLRRYNGTDTSPHDCTPGPVAGCDSDENAFVVRIDYKATYIDFAPPVFRAMNIINR